MDSASLPESMHRFLALYTFPLALAFVGDNFDRDWGYQSTQIANCTRFGQLGRQRVEHELGREAKFTGLERKGLRRVFKFYLGPGLEVEIR